MNKAGSHNLRKGNSGFALLSSLLVVLVLSIVLGVAMLSSEMQLKHASQRDAVQLAFYAAEAGVERSLFELRRNLDWNPGRGGQPPVVDVPLNRIKGDDSTVLAYYSVELENGPGFNGWETRWVRSVGRDALFGLTRVIVARILVDAPTRFLVSTLGDLRIDSGAVINSDILGQNVIFDVNPSLPPPNNQIIVEGDVFYISSIEGENNPAVTIAGSQHIPSITFPGVDLDRYRELAVNLEASGEGIYVTGDYELDLDSLNSLPVPPRIIFAEGDIRVRGKYSYSMLVVSGKNMFILDDVMADQASLVQPQIGLFAKENVLIPEGAVGPNEDITIEALVVADGGGSSDGIFMAEGQGLGTLTFTGAIAARGKGDSAVNLNAFNERVYHTDPFLNSNRNIPFLPYIANVIEWQEGTLQDEFPPSLQDS